jgi:hypothetical protein
MKLLPPPGPQRTRQLVMLAVVLPLTVYFLWRAFGSEDPAAPPPPPAVQTQPGVTLPGNQPRDPRGAATKPTATNGSLLPEPVKLASLAGVPESSEAGRNPFAYGQRPAPPPPPPPPPPPLPWSYLGATQTADGKLIGSFKEKASGTVIGRLEGQTLDGQFKVQKLIEKSAVITWMDGSNPRTIFAGGGL